MIERFDRVRGLRFPLWGNWQAEAWFAPRGTTIPLHYHSEIDGWMCNLWGRVKWFTKNKSWSIFGPWRWNGRLGWAVRSVPVGFVHACHVQGWFAVFINIERCHAGRVSASKDFVLVE